jgi:hypothetical protein
MNNDKIRLRNSSFNTQCIGGQTGGQTCTCYPPGGLPASPELDATYPYSNTNSTNDSFNDSPDSPLYDSEVEQVFSATTYLMWDPAMPSGCSPAVTDADGVSTQSTCSQSIPIPLGSISWSWSGDAIQTPQFKPNPNNSNYILGCGPESENSFVPSSQYPQWQAIATRGLTYGQLSCSAAIAHEKSRLISKANILQRAR